MAKAKKAAPEKTADTTDLVLFEEINPVALFGENNDSLEPLLQRIKEEVSSIVPDITTAKGRKAITANVSRVTKSKTELDKAGKDHVAAEKEVLKNFDKQRKRAFTFLEELQEETRKPLTEWEDKEKARVAKNECIVAAFIKAGEDSDNWMNYTVDELKELLVTVEEVTITKRLQEFEDEAAQAKANAIKNINTAIQSREKYDSEQEELTKLRAAAAEQDRINFEANERLKKDQAIREAEIKANTEKEAAIKAAEKEKEDAIKRAEEAEEKAKLDAEEAEKQKQIEVEAAAQAERDLHEAEKQKEIDAEKLREADKNHRGKINRAIVKELLKCGIDDAQAKKVVTSIAKNNIPNIKISY